jgi:hypothetical protein
MALTAGELQINITANTDKIKEVQDQLKKLQNRSNQNKNSFLKMTASIFSANAALSLVSKGLNKLKSGISDSIRLAGRFEESQNKLNVTFSNVSNQANKLRDNLVKAFGFSTKEATDLLGSTGDLLTGFGFAQDKALALSNQVQMLSADLASFQNLEGGAQQASEALTKALLGETESAKSLGIVIRQNTPEFRDQVKALMNSEGVTQDVAKAQVIFSQALSQSKNALGDFGRTQDSFANVQRRIQAAIEDVQVIIGQNFLPILTDLSKSFLENVQRFKDFIQTAEGAKIIAQIAVTIGSAFKVVTENIKGAFYVITSFVGGIIESGKTVGAFFNFLKNRSKESFDAFKNQAASTGEAFKEFGGNVVDLTNGISTSIKKEVDSFDKNVLDLGKRIKSSGASAKTQAESTGKDIGASFSKGFKSALEKEKGSLIQGAIGAVADIANQINNVIAESLIASADRRKTILENQNENELALIQERLENEIELLENNGMTKLEVEQAELERLQELLAEKTNVREQQAIQEQIDEITKQQNIRKAEDKANQDSEKAEKKLAKEKYKIDVETFKTKKRQDLITAGISLAQSIANSLLAASSAAAAAGPAAPAVFAAIFAALAATSAATIGTQIGIIASKQPPPPPKFQTGTSFAPGGTAIVGEAGPEAVELPFGSRVRSAFNTRQNFGQTVLNAVFMIDGQSIPINRIIINNREMGAVRI